MSPLIRESTPYRVDGEQPRNRSLWHLIGYLVTSEKENAGLARLATTVTVACLKDDVLPRQRSRTLPLGPESAAVSIGTSLLHVNRRSRNATCIACHIAQTRAHHRHTEHSRDLSDGVSSLQPRHHSIAMLADVWPRAKCLKIRESFVSWRTRL